MALKQFERQKVWCAMRSLKSFSVSQVVERCNQVPESVKISDLDETETKNYIWALRRCDYLTWQEQDKDNTEFTLIRDTGGNAPSTHASGLKDHNIGAVDDASQRIWNAICILFSWDLPQLASVSQSVLGTASRYTRLLVAAEYARCEPRNVRVTGTRNRYQLLLKTGAIAPLFLDNGQVFDSNLFLQELWALQSKKKRVRA